MVTYPNITDLPEESELYVELNDHISDFLLNA